eukprot:TRINITY_DN27302_c0_g1_i1.p1 TRINITY_DN27302_c0_g1~~TRINITY_DN27302_c0_g1_i1.p1  ORF type:complete len:709 (-),score=90.06 TRINITY_DN27302_c0_g1_i1:196-2322(-)
MSGQTDPAVTRDRCGGSACSVVGRVQAVLVLSLLGRYARAAVAPTSEYVRFIQCQAEGNVLDMTAVTPSYELPPCLTRCPAGLDSYQSQCVQPRREGAHTTVRFRIFQRCRESECEWSMNFNVRLTVLGIKISQLFNIPASDLQGAVLAWPVASWPPPRLAPRLEKFSIARSGEPNFPDASTSSASVESGEGQQGGEPWFLIHMAFRVDSSRIDASTPAVQEIANGNEGFLASYLGAELELKEHSVQSEGWALPAGGFASDSFRVMYQFMDYTVNQNPFECYDNCYAFNEALAPLGSGRCRNDCQCDGMRQCSEGLCVGDAGFCSPGGVAAPPQAPSASPSTSASRVSSTSLSPAGSGPTPSDVPTTTSVLLSTESQREATLLPTTSSTPGLAVRLTMGQLPHETSGVRRPADAEGSSGLPGGLSTEAFLGIVAAVSLLLSTVAALVLLAFLDKLQGRMDDGSLGKTSWLLNRLGWTRILGAPRKVAPLDSDAAEGATAAGTAAPNWASARSPTGSGASAFSGSASDGAHKASAAPAAAGPRFVRPSVSERQKASADATPRRQGEPRTQRSPSGRSAQPGFVHPQTWSEPSVPTESAPEQRFQSKGRSSAAGSSQGASPKAASKPAVSAPAARAGGSGRVEPVEPLNPLDLARELNRLRQCAPAGDRKQWYKAQCLKWHPDKNAGNEQMATSMFQVLQEKKDWFLADA